MTEHLSAADVRAIVAAMGRPDAAPLIEVPPKAPRPTYDAATDGNLYEWVIKAAKAVRVQEQVANEGQRIRVLIARRVLHPAQHLTRREAPQW